MYDEMTDEEYVDMLLNKIHNHINLSENEIEWIVLECEIYSEQMSDKTYHDEMITISKLNDDYVMFQYQLFINSHNIYNLEII